jgi:hypothetical protein
MWRTGKPRKTVCQQDGGNRLLFAQRERLAKLLSRYRYYELSIAAVCPVGDINALFGERYA